MLARIARWLSRFSPSSMKARSTICKLTGPLSLVMASPVNTRARSMTSLGRMSKTLTLASNIVISCADFILFYLFNLYHEKPRRRTTRSWERRPNERRRVPWWRGFPRVNRGQGGDRRRADSGLGDGRGDQNDRVLQDRTRPLNARGSGQALRTLAAWSPFGPLVTSNSTLSPSDRLLKPWAWMALKCTNTSSPASWVMKPKPFASLNHLTVPLAIEPTSFFLALRPGDTPPPWR